MACAEMNDLRHTARVISKGLRPLRENDVQRDFGGVTVCAAGDGDGTRDDVGDDVVIDRI